MVLIDNGKIIKKNLAQEKFNIDDLMQELRKQGIRDIDEVDKGILESCGGFSVILNESDEPVTRRDLGIRPVERSELLTISSSSRADFFASQQQKSWQAEPSISLSEQLKVIEKRLDLICEKMDDFDRQIKSHHNGMI